MCVTDKHAEGLRYRFAEGADHGHPYLAACLALALWGLRCALKLVYFLKPSWISWCPTSAAQLVQAESRMLSHLKSKYELSSVTIKNCSRGSETPEVRTLMIQGDEHATPLVLLHSFGYGLGMWSMNLDGLSRGGDRAVYAIDILGFGLSSRTKFPREPAEIETKFIRSLESWREQMKLQSAIFIGHGFGGFLATSYAIEHPERVAHLILIDPWGFAERSSFTEKYLIIPSWATMIAESLHTFNPLGVLRATGPLGPLLVAKFRPDLRRKFDDVIEDGGCLPQYLYHINAQNPSGEAGFRRMMNFLGWARRPMLKRITRLDPSVSMTFIYGSRSWVYKDPGMQAMRIRQDSDTHVVVVEVRTPGMPFPHFQ